MANRTLWIWLLAGLALSGCGPGFWAGEIASGVEIGPTADLPSTANPSALGPHEAVKVKPAEDTPASFEDGVLMSEWDGSAGLHRLYPVDLQSGERLPGYEPVALGESYTHAYAPDRSRIALVVLEDSANAKRARLLSLDFKAWALTELDLQLEGYLTGLAFSPDGQHVALLHGRDKSIVSIFDLDQMTLVSEADLDFLGWQVKYSLDGQGLMVYGTVMADRFTAREHTVGPPQARYLAVPSLETLWTAKLAGLQDGIFSKEGNLDDGVELSQPGNAVYLEPGLAFAPDRDVLYAANAAESLLTVVDFGERRVRSYVIRPRLTWLERLLSLGAVVAHAKVAEGSTRDALLSPDGRFLYVIGGENTLTQDASGRWQHGWTALGLQVIEASDGHLLAHLATEATEMSISPDGQHLFLRGWEGEKPWTEIFDVGPGELRGRLAGQHLAPVRQMNGDVLLISAVSVSESESRVTVMDEHALSVLAEWMGPHYVVWLSTP
jgi:hypothetical protein